MFLYISRDKSSAVSKHAFDSVICKPNYNNEKIQFLHKFLHRK